MGRIRSAELIAFTVVIPTVPVSIRCAAIVVLLRGPVRMLGD